jgi:hypothetical protein
VTSAFDAATAVRATGHGRYAIDADPQWSIGGRTNGGYLLATVTRAVMTALDATGPTAEPAAGGLVPLAVTGAFAAPVPAGPATVDVEVLRRGRTTSLARARLSADGVACLEVVVTAGRIAGGEPLVAGPRPPTLPPLDQCFRLPPKGPGFDVPLMGLLDQRLDPATLGFATGTPSGEGELRGYLAFDDGRPMDALALVFAVDSFPPATFDVPGLVMGWVPTLQLSVFVRALPAAGPLVVAHRARSIGGGAVDETTDLWDTTGRLLAVGHQLAAVRSTP